MKLIKEKYPFEIKDVGSFLSIVIPDFSKSRLVVVELFNSLN